ncbi:hypothetical protein ACLKA6_004577 [Drosophila palustris]
MVHRLVDESLLRQAIIGLPTVRHDGTPIGYSLLNYCEQCRCISVLDRQDEEVATFSFYAAEHPLAFNNSAAVLFPLPHFGLVNLHDLARTSNLLPTIIKAPVNVNFSQKAFEVNDCLTAQSMLLHQAFRLTL